MTPRRITNAPAGSWIQNEYSSVCPWNSDNSLLLLIHQSSFHIYDGSGQWLKPLPLPADSEPRWSRRDRHVLYYRTGNELREFDTRTDVSALLHRFIGSQNISGRGESDISEDGDHLVLADDKGQVWIYNLRTDTVSDSFLITRYFNSLYITPDNHVLVCNGGVRMLDGRSIAQSIAHQDVCRDVNGDEILVRINAGDNPVLEGCPNGIEKVNLRTGQRTCIWPIGWMPQDRGGGPASLAVHISCPDRAGCALISTYSPLNAEPGRCYKAFFDGRPPELICETGSVMMPDAEGRMAYNPTPKASVSRDGSRFVFCSNGGDTARGPNYCDVYFVKLEEAAKPVEPQPDPIVITPSPDLQAEIAVLRQAVAHAENSRNQIMKDHLWLSDEYTKLERDLAEWQRVAKEMDTELGAERQKVQALTDALAAVRAEPIAGLTEALTTIESLRGLLKAEELESSLQTVRADEATFDLGELRAQITTLQQQTETLISALTAVRTMDQTVWRKINFLYPVNQAWRRWGHLVLPSGLLQMNDVDGQAWSPISDETGDKYLLVRVEGGYEMFEAETNIK